MRTIVIGYRRFFIGAGLASAIVASLFVAFELRFDFDLSAPELRLLFFGIVIALLVKLTVFYATGLPRGWWSIAGLPDLLRIAFGTSAASVAFTLCAAIIMGREFPRSVYIIDAILTFTGISVARVLIRLISEAAQSRTNTMPRKNVLIYGAGQAGAALVKEIRGNPNLRYRVIGFIDDNANKVDDLILGVCVMGSGRTLPAAIETCRRQGQRIDQVIIAMPSASGEQRAAALACCRNAGVPCYTLPSLGNLLEHTRLAWQIRDISVEDLLNRDPIELDEGLIRESIAGRRVLVTGAAGSIGSELCRQIASFNPQMLVLLDHSESDLFRIDLELASKFPALIRYPVIADIRSASEVQEVIGGYGIECVFHAAAYKHVPMMEVQPIEAVKNNIIGSVNLVRAAIKNDVNTFVLISSDKAVNPTSVMGATKRAAELIVASHSTMSSSTGKTRFVSVRFGNVLASNGSVIPIFKSQIAAGGPVTVTHPEMRRYFMTIREAVQLVMQASAMAEGAEIFILEMGQPVKIVDLARTMIQLSGLDPDRDIEVRFVGIRPGEKLYEDLITSGENILPTRHPKIKILRHAPVDCRSIEMWMEELEHIVARGNEAHVIKHLRALIPEYQTSTVLVRREHPLGAAAAMLRSTGAA